MSGLGCCFLTLAPVHLLQTQSPSRGTAVGSAPIWGVPADPPCPVPRATPHPKPAWTSCSSCWRMWLLFPVFCSIISVAFSDSLSALRGLWTEFLTRKRKCPWTDAGSFAPLCPSPLAGSVGVHRKRFSFDSGNRPCEYVY